MSVQNLANSRPLPKVETAIETRQRLSMTFSPRDTNMQLTVSTFDTLTIELNEKDCILGLLHSSNYGRRNMLNMSRFIMNEASDDAYYQGTRSITR